MYNVFDVSKLVIRYGNMGMCSISNLKLQKLLYFIQAYFLIGKGTECFPDKIEAWDIGPVIPNVYTKYKRYNGTSIPVSSNNTDCFLVEDEKRIMDVVDFFRDYSSDDLTKLTRDQIPWIKNYVPDRACEITPKDIQEYFKTSD